MIKKLLPPKAIAVWRLRCTSFVCIASFIFGCIGVFNISFCVVLLLILFLSYMFVLLFYIPKRYSVQKYAINNKKIYIERGVYFKVNKSIPLNKIQCIEIKISPDEKVWGLCTIIFSAAGTKITISQIQHSKALQIKENLFLEGKNEI
ncbi:MAG: hypothetical protein RUMPE_01265 [Eubacteriales bacterium SKADARSKE-1]|nr:hypothetical protein [Eubacteriales bacterium SKADARSKE-1]